MDLDEPADVHWTANSTPNVLNGGEKKSCETIAEAVRFVMETLQEPSRSTALIAAVERRFGYPEIKGIYDSEEYKAFKD